MGCTKSKPIQPVIPVNRVRMLQAYSDLPDQLEDKTEVSKLELPPMAEVPPCPAGRGGRRLKVLPQVKDSEFKQKMEGWDNPEKQIEAESQLEACPTVIMQSEAEYQGSWKGQALHGFGRLRFKDGEIFQGVFVNNKAPDHIYWKNAAGDEYKGEFSDGCINGKGYMTFSDSSTYDGMWKNDLKHGQGTEVYSDGTKYIGDFHEGSKTGQGTFQFTNDCQYHGDMNNDLFHGHGEYKWGEKAQYIGAFQCGVPHGMGITNYSAGDAISYQGEFKEGLKDGSGTLTMRNGEIRTGHFVKDRLQGPVHVTKPDGSIKTGIWENGIFVSWVDK